MKQRMTIAQLAEHVAEGDRTGPYDVALTDLLLREGLADRPIVVKNLDKVITLMTGRDGGHMVVVEDLLPANKQRKTIEIEVPRPKSVPEPEPHRFVSFDDDEDEW